MFISRTYFLCLFLFTCAFLAQKGYADEKATEPQKTNHLPLKIRFLLYISLCMDNPLFLDWLIKHYAIEEHMLHSFGGKRHGLMDYATSFRAPNHILYLIEHYNTPVSETALQFLQDINQAEQTHQDPDFFTIERIVED